MLFRSASLKLPILALANTTELAVIKLVTVKFPNVPTLVMLGWAFVPSVPTKFAPVLPIVAALIADPVNVPLTVKLVNVPMLVMLGWLAVVIVPTRFAPVFPIVAAFITFASMVGTISDPVTERLVNVPTLVILGCAFVPNVPTRFELVLPMVTAFIVLAVTVFVTTKLPKIGRAHV